MNNQVQAKKAYKLEVGQTQDVRMPFSIRHVRL
jgi:hypothetical protein